uniref:Uncharacterized protein n=1 Tax=viral metagenome TaxID=1070528 RepID=A0A6C0EFT4_9ZZZZ
MCIYFFLWWTNIYAWIQCFVITSCIFGHIYI